jgi:hypothetical protein
LCMPDPDGRLQRIWYLAAFDFSADFLGVFHILLARLVNHADSVLFLLVCPIAGMYLIKLFDQLMGHYIILQGFGMGSATVWDFAV